MSDWKEIETHADHIEGYRDGHDLEAPLPTTNRSARYRHSFWVGRREKTGRYIPFDEIVESLKRAEKTEESLKQ